MIVAIAASVLDDPRWHPLLDVVVSLVNRPESRLAFSPSEISAYIRSPWLAGAHGARGSIAETMKGSFRASSRALLSDAITLRLDDTAPERGETLLNGTIRVHPLGSIVFLASPFHLIVEDETSDGGFILWMARYLGRDEVIRAYTAGRFIFRHAGGKGQFAKAAASLTFGVWPRPERAIVAMKYRCAAVMDGDERYEGHGVNVARMEAIRDQVAFSKILTGRTIENYVPHKYFRKRLSEDGLGQRADDFFRLTPEQRNYFAIKAGYCAQDEGRTPFALQEFLARPECTPEEIALFGETDPSIWASVASGFGERLASVFSEPRLRCNPGERTGLTSAQTVELEGMLTDLVRHL